MTGELDIHERKAMDSSSLSELGLPRNSRATKWTHPRPEFLTGTAT